MTTKKRLIRQMMTFICGVTLVACGQAPTVQTSSEYEVMRITTSDKELQTTYSASIRGRQDIDIYPQVSGFLTKLCVEEGQAVRKGQVLFIIDQVPYRAAWRKTMADVHAAEAQVETARLEYRSKQQLFAEKVVSEYDLSTAKNALAIAEATLEQAKALEEDARNSLSYTEVKSPSNGVVGTLPYREGALVSASMAIPLTSVSDNSEMYVYFSITEKRVHSLLRQYGSHDEVIRQMPPVRLQLNDGSLYGGQGHVESISGIINRKTGTVSVRSIFDNTNRTLLSGGIGNVIIPHREDSVIVIPQTATTELQNKILAYKVAEDGCVHSCELTVEKLNDGKDYIVRSGLAVGDVIVTEGTGLLRDGIQIDIRKDEPSK